LLGFVYLLLTVKLCLAAGSYGLRPAFLYAVFCTLIKFPEFQGQLRFHRNRLWGDRSDLIEYKASSQA
jgi:hypothetical protein